MTRPYSIPIAFTASGPVMLPLFSPSHKRNAGAQRQLAVFVLLLGLAFLAKFPSDSAKSPANAGLVHYLEHLDPATLSGRTSLPRTLSEADENELPWYALPSAAGAGQLPVRTQCGSLLPAFNKPSSPLRFFLPLLRAPPAVMSV